MVPSAPSATLYVGTYGAVSFTSPNGNAGYGTGMMFTAIVSGVPASDLTVTNTVNSMTYNFADGTSATIPNYPAPDLANGQPWYNGSTWNGGYGLTTSGGGYTPSTTTNSDGTVTLQFYDTPSETLRSGASFPISQTQSMTTTVVQTSTGAVLSQVNWQTTATANPNGVGTSEFALGPFR
jgi:hypothetical protein